MWQDIKRTSGFEIDIHDDAIKTLIAELKVGPDDRMIHQGFETVFSKFFVQDLSESRIVFNDHHSLHGSDIMSGASVA